MPRHTTNNPELRALHILLREEEELYRTGLFYDPTDSLKKLKRYSGEMRGEIITSRYHRNRFR